MSVNFLYYKPAGFFKENLPKGDEALDSGDES
jgi:hypothetical protein